MTRPGTGSSPAVTSRTARTAYQAACREWQEETGCEVPDGDLDGIWNSSDGHYRGFVLTVPSEDAVPAFGDRDAVTNPDDPDGDQIEALAWWHPRQLRDNPAVRAELLEDVKRVRRALKAAAANPLSPVCAGCVAGGL